jgi:CHAT domain-containing protein/tetratricopeptide (TPR) repeat protein
MKYCFLLILAGISVLADAQSSVNNSIDSLISTANYDAARKLISSQQTKAFGTNRSILQNKLAEVLILQGNLDEAENELKAIVDDDPFAAAVTETNLGFLYLNKARNDFALENLQQALNLFQQAGKMNTEEAARCLTTLSVLYMSAGKLNQAEANGLIALQIRQRLYNESSEAIAASYNDLGLVYSRTDPDKALDYYEKALAIYEKTHGKGHPKIAIASTNIGFAYLELKLYGDAVNNLETAEAIWAKLYPGGHPNHALALVNLGRTYDRMGDKKAALGYLDRALAMYRKSYGDKHPDISNVLNLMGILKLNENKFDAALADFQSAIRANAIGFNDADVAKNPKVTQYYNGKVLLYSLRQKALALEGRHYGKTLKFEELRLALSTLHSCDTLIDDIRYRSSDENDKLEVGSSANDVYEDGVRIAHAMSEMTIDFKKYRQDAFYFAEKSKSAVLQESIADANAKSFAGIPDNVLSEEKALKATLALLAQKLSQKPGLEEEKKLREELFSATRKYETFTKSLEHDFPDYYNLKFNQASPSIREIQQILDDNTAVVCYFLASTRLYTFVITKRRFSIYASTLPADFDKMIKGFNNSLYYRVWEPYYASSNALSKVLLRGLPAFRDLVIVPAGRLGTMPFEALPLNKLESNQDFNSVNYLVTRYAVSYEFSAGVMLQKARNGKKAENQSIFLCAPISFPAKDNLDELPGTDKEVNAIASLFPSSSLVAKRGDANETLIKSGKLANYKYLHFATHGVVDEQSPELSRIFLQSSPTEDGNVFSGEIFNLRLNADLAVLSACQTGLGKVSKGEGVIGLSRALVYAGARSIMVSYWSVADESTSQLMTDFYKQFVKQSTPNYREALQQAKTAMINHKEYAAPYYWAPFVLIGF